MYLAAPANELAGGDVPAHERPFSPVRGECTGPSLSVVAPVDAHVGEASGASLFQFESTRVETNVEIGRNAKARLRVAASGSTVRAAATVAGAAAAAGIEFAPGSSIVRIPLAVDAGPTDDRDAFVLGAVDKSFAADLMAVLSAKPVLRDVATQLAAKREPTYVSLRLAMAVTAELIGFVVVGSAVGGASGGTAAAAGALHAEGTPSAPRQRILREQGVLDAAADVLHSAFDGVYDVNAVDQRSPIVELAQLLHKLLRVSFKECPENELYCSRWLPMLLREACRATVASDVHAEQTVAALLATNRKILESAIGASTIEELVGLFAKSRDPRFLTMLGSLCTVGTSAIEANQDLITDRLFGRDVDVIAFRLPPTTRGASKSVARAWVGAPVPDGRCPLCTLKIGSCVHTRVEASSPGVPGAGDDTSKADDSHASLLKGYASSGRFGRSASKMPDTPMSIAVEVSCVGFEDGAWVLLQGFLERASAAQRGIATAFAGLCAQLCFKRNYNAIRVLSPLFPYDLVMAVATEAVLPCALRAAFCRLLRNLYLDCDPMSPMQLPILTRVWSDIELKLPCAPAPQIAQFHTMREFIVAYLQSVGNFQTISAAERDHNELTLEVLMLAKLLLQFGCYESAAEMRKFLLPMSSILDSVNDIVVTDERTSASDPSSAGGAHSSYRQPSNLRFETSENSLPVVRCKKLMCEILVVVSDIRIDWRVSHFLVRFKDAMRQMSAPRGVIASLAAAAGVSAASTHGGHGTLSAAEVSLFEGIFDSDSSADSLDMVSFYDSSSGAADRNPSLVFLDLTRYKDAALVNAAFELLLRGHTQMHETLGALDRLQVLYDADIVAQYRSMQSDIATLRVLCNSSELWLSLHGPAFREQALAVMTILDRASLLCASGGVGGVGAPVVAISADLIFLSMSRRSSTAAGPGSDAATEFVAPQLPELLLNCRTTTHLESQRLLRNMGAAGIYCELLKINPGHDSGVTVAVHVLRRCHVAVQTFCRGNARNQALMEPAIEQIISHLPLDIGAEETLVALYAGNRKLSEACPEGVVRACVNMVERHRDKRWLAPLHELVACRGVPIKRNQLLILKCLLEASPRTLLTYIDPQGMEERAALLREYQSSGDAVLTGALAYHIDFIELLAEAADGKIGAAEAKCQALIPIADAVTQIEAIPVPAAKAAFVNFVNFVFFDAENAISDDNDAAQGWRLLDHFCKLFREVVGTSGVAPKWVRCVYSACLPAIAQFIASPIASVAWTPSRTARTTELAMFAGTLFACAHDDEARSAAVMCMRALDRRVKTLDVQVPQHAEAMAWSGGVAAPAPLASESLRAAALVPVDMDGETVRCAQELPRLVHLLHAHDHIIHLAETEFEVMCAFYVNIEKVTSVQYGADGAVSFSLMTSAVVELLGGAKGKSLALPKRLSLQALKIMRKFVEMECPLTTPASDWSTSDWDTWADSIQRMQDKVVAVPSTVPLLCRIIGTCNDTEMLQEAVYVCVALLLGGNRLAQKLFLRHMRGDPDSHYMVEVMHEHLRGAMAFAKKRKKAAKGRSAGVAAPAGVDDEADLADLAQMVLCQSILRFLQLLCEGHNLRLQRFMSSQGGSMKSVNLVGAAGLLLVALEKAVDSAVLPLMNQTIDFIIESLQGPCLENQRVVVEHHIPETSARVMLWTAVSIEARGIDKDSPVLAATRGKIATLLRAVLEGSSDAPVFAQVARTLDFGVLRARLVHLYKAAVRSHRGTRQLSALLRPGELPSLDVTMLPLDAFDGGGLREAFDLYLLMEQLADAIPDLADLVSRDAYAESDRTAVWFFRKNSCRVEILRAGVLERVYFPRPVVTNFLANATRETFVWGVDRSSPQSKIDGMFNASTDFLAEMQHQARIARVRWFLVISQQLENLKFASFVLACIINTLVLLSYGVSTPTSQYMSRSELEEYVVIGGDSVLGPHAATAITFFGALQTITSTSIVLAFFVNYGALIVKKRWKQREVEARQRRAAFTEETGAAADRSVLPAWKMLLEYGPAADGVAEKLHDLRHNLPVFLLYRLQSLAYLFDDGTVKYYTLYVIFSWLGNFASPFFFCFHLLDLMSRFEQLRNVMRAVLYPRKQLFLTLALGLVVIYLYSIIGFVMFRHTYLFTTRDINATDPNGGPVQEMRCETLLSCFVATVREILRQQLVCLAFTDAPRLLQMNWGWRDGGGIGDSLTFPSHDIEPGLYIGRVFFDLTYWAILVVIFLNVIFGVIVDTFADLRGLNQEKSEDMLSRCFICNIERGEFDRGADGFEKHIKRDHHMWAYVYLISYLRLRDETEMSGSESYLRECIDNEKTEWFPMSKAMCLDATDEGNSEVAALGKRMDAFSAEMVKLRVAVAALDVTRRG